MSIPTATRVVASLQLARDFQMGDLRRSIFLARTNFLTALGLVTYTEFWGHFLIGIEAARQSFDAFFPRLGSNYQQILTAEPKIYDLIRNGLAHEYLPKSREFTICGEVNDLTDAHIDQQRPIGLVVVPGRIEIINSRYYLDFQRAVDQFIAEVPQRLAVPGSSVETRFNQVNFSNFR